MTRPSKIGTVQLDGEFRSLWLRQGASGGRDLPDSGQRIWTLLLDHLYLILFFDLDLLTGVLLPLPLARSFSYLIHESRYFLP